MFPLLFSLSPLARADDAADARAAFDRLVALEAAFDPALATMYADDATIVVDRDGKVATIPGAGYKQMIPAGLQVAKAEGERSEYAEVRVVPQDDRFVVSAVRRAPSRCFTDDAWSITLARRDDGWKVVEERAKSPSISACPVPKPTRKAADRYAARIHGPTQVDEETVVESMVADGWLLASKARLIKMAVAELDLGAVQPLLASISTRQGCADATTRALLDEGVVFRFEWVDRDGAPVALYDVTRAACLLAEAAAPKP